MSTPASVSLQPPFYLPGVVASATSTSSTTATTTTASAASSTTSTSAADASNGISSAVILRVGLSFIGTVTFVVLLGFFAKAFKARRDARRRGRPVPSFGDIFFSSFDHQANSAAWLSGGGAGRNFSGADLLMYLERLREDRERKEEEAKLPPRLWEYVVEEQEGKTGLRPEEWDEKRLGGVNDDDDEGPVNLPIMLCTPSTNPPSTQPLPPDPKSTNPLPDISTTSTTIATFLISFPDPDDPRPLSKKSYIKTGANDTPTSEEREAEQDRQTKRREAWKDRTDLPPICFGLLDLDLIHPVNSYPPSGPHSSDSKTTGPNGGKSGKDGKMKYTDEELAKALRIRHLERTGGRVGWSGDRGYHI